MRIYGNARMIQAPNPPRATASKLLHTVLRMYVIRNRRGLPERAGLDVLRGIWILEARLRAGWCEVRGSPAEEEEEMRRGEE
jgi:hypothetical protein